MSHSNPTLGLWRNRTFSTLFTAQAISLAGSGVAVTSRVVNASAAFSDTTGVPHEYFYQRASDIFVIDLW
jgi:hypothetical protein